MITSHSQPAKPTDDDPRVMRQRALTVVLVIGLLFGAVTLASSMSLWRLPDNQQGYSPQQPIDYSHRLHAGELGIDCKFCHAGAETSRHAGIPSTSVCMKCHKVVTRAKDAPEEPVVSVEIQKLHDSFNRGEAIPWVRVHKLPDFVYFSHQAHVTAGVSCQKCHGPVETMQRIHQQETLSMGWCINCHREATEKGINGRAVHASTNCSVCHY